MNKKYQVLNKIIGCLLPFLALCFSTISCTDESFIGEGYGKQEGDQMAVLLSISTPATQKPTTRSGEQEEQIKEVSVLVFSQLSADTEYQFLYSVEGANISRPDGHTTTFTAMLKSSKNPVKLILIANASQTVAEKYPEAGDTETRVKEKLVYKLDNGNGSPKLITGYLPMYGEHLLSRLDATQTNNNIQIKMLRSVARVDVYNNDATGHFLLQSIQVFRPYNKLQLIPNKITVNSGGSPKAESPSVPGQSTFYPTDFPMPQQNIINEVTSIEQIYLPEAPAPTTNKQVSDATCLVVGGIYDDGISLARTGYYRIDINPSEHPFGQILRNHRYMFVIQKVSTAGWETPEEAATNVSSGIIASVEPWDEHTTDMYFDGEHHYGLSSRNITLHYQPNMKETISINTDLTGELLQWVDVNGNPINDDNPSTSLSNDYFEVSLVEETNVNNKVQKYIQCYTKQENNNSSNHIGYVMIHVNRWKIMVTITQLSNKNSNKSVNILSTYSAGGIDYSSSKAMKAILDNHFGIGKTVSLKKINYANIPLSINNTYLPNKLLMEQNILILGHNSRPEIKSAQRILDWLSGSKNRVLVLGFDWKDPGVTDDSKEGHPEYAITTNYNILRLLREDVTPYWYDGGNNESIGETGPIRSSFIAPFELNASNSYFFRTGPFTKSLDIGITNCGYWISDYVWGRLEIHSPDIVPLIVYKNVVKDDGSGLPPDHQPNPQGDGRMILGVDMRKRIVYVGDSQLFEMGSDNDLRQCSRLDNENGNLTNDYSRIMANLWAWMIEEVVLANTE